LCVAGVRVRGHHASRQLVGRVLVEFELLVVPALREVAVGAGCPEKLRSA
jgi:hypothetical protein